MSDKIKVNLDSKATLIDGTPVTWTHLDGTAKETTWAYMAYKAVSEKYQGEADMDFKTAYDRGKLAKRLLKGGDIELSPESMTELKRLFAKRYNCDQVVGFAEALGMEE